LSSGTDAPSSGLLDLAVVRGWASRIVPREVVPNRTESEVFSMATDQRRVVVMTGATAHSTSLYHRDFPEIRAEGETPALAGTYLINQLTRALDSALTNWRRSTLEQAIVEIQAFVAENP
jgi:hypothetical protein